MRPEYGVVGILANLSVVEETAGILSQQNMFTFGVECLFIQTVLSFARIAEAPYLTVDFLGPLSDCVCKKRKIFVWFPWILCLHWHASKPLQV